MDEREVSEACAVHAHPVSHARELPQRSQSENPLDERLMEVIKITLNEAP